MFQKFKHSYATQRLLENRFRIYHNGTQILKFPFKDFPYWVYPKLETKLQIGMPLLKGEVFKTNRITNYDDLNFYGVMISKRKPTIQRKFAQKVEYFLTTVSIFKPDVGEIPQSHYVEINPQKRGFRLVGDNSSGEWFYPSKKKENIFYERKSFFDRRGYDYHDALSKYLPAQSREPEYTKPIPEIAIGITEDGKLLCLQEERENPVIGIVGKKRNAKSLLKHRLEDNAYHKWNKKSIELNDVMLETDTYCQIWNPITKFANMQLINEVSVPLPMVYLHPKTRTLKNMIATNETGYEIYLSFMDFILDFNNILKGKKEWTFENSGIYFRNLLYDDEGNLDKKGLAYCKNYKQMESIVHSRLLKKVEDDSGKQKKTPEGVIARILNVLKDIDNAKILDSSNKTKAKWTLEFPNGDREEHYPWTACLIADLVPSIVTHNIKNNHPDFHPQYANFIMNDLFKNQNENDYFKNNNIELFMFFDELLSLVNSSVAVETFETIVRESGHSRIGFVYCSQYWDKIPEFVRSQTDYVFSFNQKRNQAKEIVQDFDALKHREKDLINLKKGEFIAFSQNPMVLYDEYGKKEYVEDQAIKATVFPSISAHKAPKQYGA